MSGAPSTPPLRPLTNPPLRILQSLWPALRSRTSHLQHSSPFPPPSCRSPDASFDVGVGQPIGPATTEQPLSAPALCSLTCGSFFRASLAPHLAALGSCREPRFSNSSLLRLFFDVANCVAPNVRRGFSRPPRLGEEVPQVNMQSSAHMPATRQLTPRNPRGALLDVRQFQPASPVFIMS
jgi:hypothetical protein